MMRGERSLTCAAGIGVEQMAFLERIWQQTKCSLPGAVEQVESSVNSFPVGEMVERIADGLAVSSLQDVLRRKD